MNAQPAAVPWTQTLIRPDGPPVTVVLGTRPEIIKLSQVSRLLGPRGRVVFTGQHYDPSLTDTFFTGFRMPAPHATLRGVGGTSQIIQISRMITDLGNQFAEERPSAVVVQGDTNTVSAAAQAAHYCGIPVVHVEAGLRSYDRNMPEEINRRVAGTVTDLHCAPTATAMNNLLGEGVDPHRIELTGNTIVEAVQLSLPPVEDSLRFLEHVGLQADSYALATIHRPENTDDADRLRSILTELAKFPLPVLMPLHPRTRGAALRAGLGDALDRLHTVDPVDHRQFLSLARHARLLVSDSGGVQEECTVLKKPLLVVRNSTERPEAIQAGFAQLVQPGRQLGKAADAMLADTGLHARLAVTPSPYGDGHASERIVQAVARLVDRDG
ncbi:UDP-N-acetyl glucosamine 2-epimerase [Streptomyces spiroverticillatus]|uniref:UDP-N-acetyl glucosamine 2-epimerase n=1 Tax=Streptomyces finlayi TaxID=67296 RepID=A0A918X331_9ACTN|nr:UDP-N-acetyl glucosamine 2-epimerase [Streptomyces spiroverticillatus]GHD07215.1 UDP-N-acetyl glucosamine 2-epimerase [Streptomyces finlayi]